MQKNCEHCTEPFNAVKSTRRFCSKRCYMKFANPEGKSRNQLVGEKVTEWRRRTKQRAVDYKGGKCIVCGYDRCNACLDFHHLNPAEKDFSISATGNTRGWDKVKSELDKCVLLCRNCHGEVHAGLITLKVNDEPDTQS